MGAAAFILAVAIASAVDAQSLPSAPITVRFGCDGQAGATCFFSLLNDRGGVRGFTLKAGTRRIVADVRVGQPFYVSIDYPNSGSATVCQTLVGRGRFCQLHYVKAGYNN